jgi:NTP pyrophosphatase (non-canonical NTP hydrolase)
MTETIRGLQAEVRELALAHGFNTTDVPLNFCFTHSEVAELAEALHASVDRGFRAWRKAGDVPSEVADVTVFLLRIADMLGFDLQDAVNAKLRVVAARTYRPGPNGPLIKDA